METQEPSNRICRIVWSMRLTDLRAVIAAIETGSPLPRVHLDNRTWSQSIQARDVEGLVAALPWLREEEARQTTKRSAAAKKAAVTRKAIAAGEDVYGLPSGEVSDEITPDMSLARRMTRPRKRGRNRRAIRATKND